MLGTIHFKTKEDRVIAENLAALLKMDITFSIHDHMTLELHHSHFIQCIFEEILRREILGLVVSEIVQGTAWKTMDVACGMPYWRRSC